MTESTVPVCEELMAGANASSSDTVVATLDLKEGYYRTSAESQEVLECYSEDACVGGLDAENYCADGYEGPCKYGVPIDRCPVLHIKTLIAVVESTAVEWLYHRTIYITASEDHRPSLQALESGGIGARTPQVAHSPHVVVSPG